MNGFKFQTREGELEAAADRMTRYLRRFGLAQYLVAGAILLLLWGLTASRHETLALTVSRTQSCPTQANQPTPRGSYVPPVAHQPRPRATASPTAEPSSTPTPTPSPSPFAGAAAPSTPAAHRPSGGQAASPSPSPTPTPSGGSGATPPPPTVPVDYTVDPSIETPLSSIQSPIAAVSDSGTPAYLFATAPNGFPSYESQTQSAAFVIGVITPGAPTSASLELLQDLGGSPTVVPLDGSLPACQDTYPSSPVTSTMIPAGDTSCASLSSTEDVVDLALPADGTYATDANGFLPVNWQITVDGVASTSPSIEVGFEDLTVTPTSYPEETTTTVSGQTVPVYGSAASGTPVTFELSESYALPYTQDFTLDTAGGAPPANPQMEQFGVPSGSACSISGDGLALPAGDDSCTFTIVDEMAGNPSQTAAGDFSITLAASVNQGGDISPLSDSEWLEFDWS